MFVCGGCLFCWQAQLAGTDGLEGDALKARWEVSDILCCASSGVGSLPFALTTFHCHHRM